MEAKQEKKPFRPRFNLFDAVIIVLVLAALGGALLLRNRSAGTTGEASHERSTMRYTVEFTRAPEDMIAQLHVGDKVYRSTDSAYLGTIAAVTSRAHAEQEYSETAGDYVCYEVPESYDIYLTIEGQGYSTGKDIYVEDVAPKLCGEMFVKGKGFARLGFVCNMDTMDAEIAPGTRTGSGDREATYVIRLSDLREMLLGGVHVGDQLYEKVTGALLGTVEEVWTEPYGETRLGPDGQAVYALKKDVYYQYARVRGNLVEKDDGYYLDGGTELKVGAQVIVISQYIERTGVFYALEDLK